MYQSTMLHFGKRVRAAERNGAADALGSDCPASVWLPGWGFVEARHGLHDLCEATVFFCGVEDREGDSVTPGYCVLKPMWAAQIMQNIGYFAPWSRQNSWADRIAINNIRKANTPQSLAMKQQKIEKENAKFARKFSSPHTSMYTGVKQVSKRMHDARGLRRDRVVLPEQASWTR